ncbi:MAG: DUF928 domain-containing protein [Burkholderiaceae bacterium]|nr:DUF928 domain-containing protein [Burkholderiaceae bacterium]
MLLASAGALWSVQPAVADTQEAEVLLRAPKYAQENGAKASAPLDAKPDRVALPQAPTPIFVPRVSRGAPALRVGGASRGTNTRVAVRVLVPQYEEAALTASDQPAFPWHLSGSTEHSVNFTLVNPDQIDPVIDLTIPGPIRAGFHWIDLSAHDARLAVGHRYYWFIAIVTNPKRRSADIAARGSVERVSLAAALAAQIAAARPEERAGLFSRAGIWYDALEATRQLMPGADAKAQRNALLAQVGIEIEPAD